MIDVEIAAGIAAPVSRKDARLDEHDASQLRSPAPSDGISMATNGWYWPLTSLRSLGGLALLLPITRSIGDFGALCK